MANAAKATRPITPAAAVTCALAAFAVLDAEAEVLWKPAEVLAPEVLAEPDEVLEPVAEEEAEPEDEPVVEEEPVAEPVEEPVEEAVAEPDELEPLAEETVLVLSMTK